jgi:hypothetical protein
MARSLSERVLDMVERDRRFIGLPDSTVLLWIKLMRLYGRGELPACTDPDLSKACSEEELLHFLRMQRSGGAPGWDLTRLVERQLLVKIDKKFAAPEEIACPDGAPLITIVHQS